MPAVAQISVNFASLTQTRGSANARPTSVRATTPLSVSQYLLFNREENSVDHLNNPVYLNYDGGFITAGNKVNVKHNDLQIRTNLDIGNSIYADNIFSRRFDSGDNYKITRPGNTRSVTIAPFLDDTTNAISRNNIRLTSTGDSKNITLFINYGNSLADKENSIILNNTNSLKTMDLKTGNYSLNTDNITNVASSTISNRGVNFNIEGLTTITGATRITGNFSLGGTSFDKFTINSTSGNVNFTGTLSFPGNLSINSTQFTVNGANGNTVINGTLTVNQATSIIGTTTLSNSLTFNTGGPNDSTRRLTGVRRVSNFNDIVDINRVTDALTIGDFVERYYNEPKTITSSYTITNNGIGDSQTTILCNNSTDIDIILPATGFRVGTQVSFIRMNAANVRFVAGTGAQIRSAPTNSFTRLAFQNSVGTCFFAGNVGGTPTWYVFGDLLPN